MKDELNEQEQNCRRSGAWHAEEGGNGQEGHLDAAEKKQRRRNTGREEGVCVVEKLVTVRGPLMCVSPLVHTGFTSALCGTVTVIFL